MSTFGVIAFLLAFAGVSYLSMAVALMANCGHDFLTTEQKTGVLRIGFRMLAWGIACLAFSWVAFVWFDINPFTLS